MKLGDKVLDVAIESISYGDRDVPRLREILKLKGVHGGSSVPRDVDGHEIRVGDWIVCTTHPTTFVVNKLTYRESLGWQAHGVDACGSAEDAINMDAVWRKCDPPSEAKPVVTIVANSPNAADNGVYFNGKRCGGIAGGVAPIECIETRDDDLRQSRGAELDKLWGYHCPHELERRLEREAYVVHRLIRDLSLVQQLGDGFARTGWDR